MLAIASVLFSNCYAFFSNVYYLQCLFLENNIQTFAIIDSVQRQNTVYTFQLKSFKHNMIPLQVFPRKKCSLITVMGWKLFKTNKSGRWGRLFRNEEYMNEDSILLFCYICLLFTSFGIYVIHPKERVYYI